MWEAGEIGGGGREAYNAKKSYIFHNRKGLKGGRQEKKGQDPEMQGTGCGRYGAPVRGGGGGGGWFCPPVPPPPPPPLLFRPGYAVCLRDILG